MSIFSNVDFAKSTWLILQNRLVNKINITFTYTYKQKCNLGLDMGKFQDKLPPVLHAVEDKKIDHPIFSLYLPNKGQKGEITLGGKNAARIEADTAVTANLRAGHAGAFLIEMTKVMLGDKEVCELKDGNCEAIIDSGCSDIYGPEDQVKDFIKDVLSKLQSVVITRLS